jgi:hypothetical protein
MRKPLHTTGRGIFLFCSLPQLMLISLHVHPLEWPGRGRLAQLGAAIGQRQDSEIGRDPAVESRAYKRKKDRRS